VPPKYSGSLTVGVRAFEEKLTLGARMHFASVRAGTVWQGGSASRVGVDVSWPEYRIFDVFGSYKLTEDAIINFSVENITDEYYFGALSSVGIPSPGRTARIGLTRTLGGDDWPTVPNLTLGGAAEGTPGSNWTGLYLGGHLGYGFADISGVTTAGDGTTGGIPATEAADVSLNDLQRGVQAGFNYQFANRIVIGLEGDFSWMKHFDTQTAVATEAANLTAGGWLQAKTDYKLDWVATLRGRIGFAYDRLLVYGTGGLAFLEETETRTQYEANSAGRTTEAASSESASMTRRGWTLGAGLEYALTNNWSLKAEYSYLRFGSRDFLFGNATAGVMQGTTPQSSV
jgi:hemoglobin/transferrin/lactoferrin receptor protein